MCCDKRESPSPCHLWLSMTPTLALTATLWLTLALFGSLLLSNFAFIQSLIGSQVPCLALRAAATLTHFILVRPG